MTSQIGDLRQDAVILAALSRIEGMGARTLYPLLQAAGSPQALWQADDAFLKARLKPAQKAAFCKQRDEGLNDDWLAQYEQQGIQLLPYTAPQYPRLLKEIHDPPLLLYVKGRLEALSGKTLAVVGTRHASEYGCRATEALIGQLVPAGVCIVSGLAAGVDTAAHWAALNHGLPTVAVFGCGLDIIFPSPNRKLSEAIVAGGGALVSEYPLGYPGNKYTYPQRNRIVAGLSHGVLVVEGNVRSGALITARQALEEGRTVFAVPGNIFSPGSQGPLYLVKNGATPVAQGEDILNDLRWWADEVPVQLSLDATGTAPADSASLAESPLSEEERQLLSLLPFDPVSVETVQHQSGLPSARLNELLTLLELEGLIVVLPGAKVCRK